MSRSATWILLATLAGCAPAPSSAPAPTVRSTTTLAVPNADNRGAAITARGQDVVVTWTATRAEATNVYASMSRNGGTSFQPPVRVNTVAGDARFTGEQAPRVALGDDLIVAWQSRADGRSAIRLARSTDSGRSFQPPVTVHESGLAGTRGWASLALDPSGRAHVVWLDTRPAVAAAPDSQGPPPMPAGHVHGAHKTTRQNIYQAVIGRDGPPAEALVAADVCFCCKTSVATGPNDAVYAAWRHIYPPNLRDMAVATSTDGGGTFSAPVRVSEDGWAIDGCPEDGPSLAVDDAGVLHIVWPTITPGSTELRKGIFYSYSTDKGRTFAPRLRVDTGDVTARPAHPQLAVAGGRVAVTWDEGEGDTRHVRVRLLRSSSTARWVPAVGAAVTIGSHPMASYPAIAYAAPDVVVAWTEIDGPSSAVRTARVALP